MHNNAHIIYVINWYYSHSCPTETQHYIENNCALIHQAEIILKIEFLIHEIKIFGTLWKVFLCPVSKYILAQNVCTIWYDEIQAINISGLLVKLVFSNLLHFMFMRNLLQLSFDSVLSDGRKLSGIKGLRVWVVYLNFRIDKIMYLMQNIYVK